MNKNEILKIESFIDEVSKLPEVLLTPEDARAFTSDGKSEIEGEKVYKKQELLFKKVQDIKIRLIAYFRAIIGENSVYLGLLSEITFKPQNFVYNTVHFENNRAWLDDKNKLLNLLKLAKTEFEEKIRIAKQNPENSIIHYFKTKEAKGIILTALLAIFTGILTKDIWFDKLFSQPQINKPVVIRDVSLINADKRNVVERATKEIFTNYFQTINSLAKEYVSVSTMRYIEDYLEKEIPNIETRILNKSYIHRFATNEGQWADSDFNEVATLIRARTIIRIKEISEDVESKAQGAFTLTDDKIRLLIDAVKTELGENH